MNEMKRCKFGLTWFYYGLIFADKKEESLMNAVNCVLTKDQCNYDIWYILQRKEIDDISGSDNEYHEKFKRMLIEKFHG